MVRRTHRAAGTTNRTRPAQGTRLGGKRGRLAIGALNVCFGNQGSAAARKTSILMMIVLGLTGLLGLILTLHTYVRPSPPPARAIQHRRLSHRGPC
jgi:hypothetical protein